MPLHTVHPRAQSGLADSVARPAPGRHVWTAEPWRRAAQQRMVLVAAAAVLLVHALLLGGWTARPGREERGDGDRPVASRPALQAARTVRIDAAAVPAPVAARQGGAAALSGGEQPRRVATAATGSASEQITRPVMIGPTAASASTPRPAPAPAPASDADANANASVSASANANSHSHSHVNVNADANAAAAATDADASPSASDAADRGGLPVPTYATQLPPSTTLQFTLRRGTATGRAELVWQAEAGRYQLLMRGRVPAAPQLAWRSEGTLDAHGIAPDRYGEWRRGRELRAANFQRGGGSAVADRITFSGPQAQYPLPAGAQDRLSWLLQLPAVLAANPALQARGSTVQLFVAGARGDAEVWTFTVQGTDAVTLADGSSIAGTLHLQREPSRPYDTRADVWLDPARGHLPVRALLTVLPGGDATELVLERQP